MFIALSNEKCEKKRIKRGWHRLVLPGVPVAVAMVPTAGIFKSDWILSIETNINKSTRIERYCPIKTYITVSKLFLLVHSFKTVCIGA